MIKIKVIRNVFLNKIDLHDQLSRMHRSPPGVAKIFQIRKIQKFDKSHRYFRFDHRVFSSG